MLEMHWHGIAVLAAAQAANAELAGHIQAQRGVLPAAVVVVVVAVVVAVVVVEHIRFRNPLLSYW